MTVNSDLMETGGGFTAMFNLQGWTDVRFRLLLGSQLASVWRSARLPPVRVYILGNQVSLGAFADVWCVPTEW